MKIQYQGHEFRGTGGEWFADKYGNVKSERGNGPLNMVQFSGLCLSSCPEASANSVLVSASPKLLQALIEAVEEMDSGDEPGAGSEWHTKARAAILQALGVSE